MHTFLTFVHVDTFVASGYSAINPTLDLQRFDPQAATQTQNKLRNYVPPKRCLPATVGDRLTLQNDRCHHTSHCKLCYPSCIHASKIGYSRSMISDLRRMAIAPYACALFSIQSYRKWAGYTADLALHRWQQHFK